MIAAIEVNLIVVLIAAAVGIVNYFVDQKKKNDGNQLPPDPASPEKRPVVTNRQSEEERLRKFLEALGVPTAPPPPSRPHQQNPAPVSAQRPHGLEPQPQRPPVYQRPQRTAPVQSPRPGVPDPVLQKKQEPKRLLEPIGVVEQTRGFDAHAMPVNLAFPETRIVERHATEAKSADGSFEISTPSAQDIFKALQSPQNLRTLILLREILGPPPGLHRS